MKVLKRIAVLLAVLLVACLGGCTTDTPVVEECVHSYVKSVESIATCTEDGVTRYICKKCNDVKEEKTPAFGHKYEEILREEGNCKSGIDIAYVCSNCGHYYNEHKEVVHVFKNEGKTMGGRDILKCKYCYERTIKEEDYADFDVDYELYDNDSSHKNAYVIRKVFLGDKFVDNSDITIPTEYNGKPIEEVRFYCYDERYRDKTLTIRNMIVPDEIKEFYLHFNGFKVKELHLGKGLREFGFYGYCKSIKEVDYVFDVYLGGDIYYWLNIRKRISTNRVGYNLYFNGELVEHVVISENMVENPESIFIEGWKPDAETGAGIIPSTNRINDLFNSCYSLKSVVIEKMPRPIGWDMFENCRNLVSVENKEKGLRYEYENFVGTPYSRIYELKDDTAPVYRKETASEE